MEEATKATPSTDEATIEKTDGFNGPIPRMPPVRRWKSALIKTTAAIFVLICVAFYADALLYFWY